MVRPALGSLFVFWTAVSCVHQINKGLYEDRRIRPHNVHPDNFFAFSDDDFNKTIVPPLP